jgi:mono/diheme cytochrome c family protein
MFRTILVAGALGMGLSLTAASPSTSGDTPAFDDTPTYNEHVGALLFENCVGCHRPEQIGPMSLLSYQDARRWARAIKAKVVSREMPPWFADPDYGHFANDISLSEEEIATIVAWVDGGAPEGEGASPEVPQFSAGGWSHPSGRDPDLVYQFPIEWHVPADGETPNFDLVTPLMVDRAMRVEATEVRPGNFAATHHITTRFINMEPGMKMGTGPAWPGGPVVDYVMVPDPDGANEPRRVLTPEEQAASEGFGAYLPGVGARVTPEGQSRSIRGDLFGYILWNLHYQATGLPETARPEIGIWFAQDEEVANTVEERSLSLDEFLSEGEQLIAPPPISEEERLAAWQFKQIGQGLSPLLDPITPHDGDWTVSGIGAFQNDVYIQGLFVHAHLRGKDFTFLLTRPDGTEEILLRVPNYNFDWQYTYELAEPVFAPAGSTVKSIARYDNSRANRHNPAPQKEVYWGEQSWDDMFSTSVKYTLASEEHAQRQRVTSRD